MVCRTNALCTVRTVYSSRSHPSVPSGASFHPHCTEAEACARATSPSRMRIQTADRPLRGAGRFCAQNLMPSDPDAAKPARRSLTEPPEHARTKRMRTSSSYTVRTTLSYVAAQSP
jgi:hypothetical protein